jgi:hypothetical protein
MARILKVDEFGISRHYFIPGVILKRKPHLRLSFTAANGAYTNLDTDKIGERPPAPFTVILSHCSTPGLQFFFYRS